MIDYVGYMISAFMLRWMCSFGQLADGVVGFLTLGLVKTSFHLWFAKIRARFLYYYGE